MQPAEEDPEDDFGDFADALDAALEDAFDKEPEPAAGEQDGAGVDGYTPQDG